MSGVALSYAGVHQIFQLALAAEEIGRLNGLICSIADKPQKWGRMLSQWVPSGINRPLGLDAIPGDRISEYPWPLITDRLARKFMPSICGDHLRSNAWFDRRAATWLREQSARVFVGAETCALECLQAAGKKGMSRVLDCPGVPSSFLDAEAQKAAEHFGVVIPDSSNSVTMHARKKQELDEADVVLCCSEFQREKLTLLNPEIKRTEVIPLWTDFDYWSEAAAKRSFSEAGKPLRVLYAGSISLRKGVPYLLEAIEPLAAEVSLTLVGSVSPEVTDIVTRFRSHCYLHHVAKPDLRRLYENHDVLVMPSLGDSFGFVTTEAMASGMPVIASTHAGAPTPTSEFRVPPHNASCIREKLLEYYSDRELLRHHADESLQFARTLRPEHYRAKAATLFSELLNA